MLPPRATLPTTPQPGGEDVQVVVDHDDVRRGLDRRPALHRGAVLGDLRDAVEAALGRADRVGDHEVGEVGEEAVLHGRREQRGARADREQRRRRPTGRASASSASISGRPIASPVIMIALTFSRSTVDHTSSASNFGVSTTVLPLEHHAEHSPLARAVHERRQHERHDAGTGWRRPCRASSVSDSTLWPVMASMPCPSAMNTSSWRHTTPFGMPVVPPV